MYTIPGEWWVTGVVNTMCTSLGLTKSAIEKAIEVKMSFSSLPELDI